MNLKIDLNQKINILEASINSLKLINKDITMKYDKLNDD